MVKECQRPRRRRRRTRRPSAAVLHVSRPSFVQRRRRPTGSRRSVGRSVARVFDANSCLSNVVWTVFVLQPADGGWANSPSSMRRRKKTRLPFVESTMEFDFCQLFCAARERITLPSHSRVLFCSFVLGQPADCVPCDPDVLLDSPTADSHRCVPGAFWERFKSDSSELQ